MLLLEHYLEDVFLVEVFDVWSRKMRPESLADFGCIKLERVTCQVVKIYLDPEQFWIGLETQLGSRQEILPFF